MAQTETEIVQEIGSDYGTKYGFSNPDEAKNYFFKSGRGLSHELVEAIAEHKQEPDWMRKRRHEALDAFLRRPLPMWGGDLTGIDFENIFYYIKPTEKQANSWEDLPSEIKDTWTSSASRRRRRSTSRGSARSTRARSSTTSCRRTSSARA